MRCRRIASKRTETAGRHGRARHLAALLLSGLLSAAPGCGAAVAQTTPSPGANQTPPFEAQIDEASRRFRVPASWIDAVMRAESAYDSRAVSSAGAVGLMQIMPGTWLELRARHGLGSDPFDPRDNILAGAAYLREMHDRYGNITAILAAYNAGPQRYDDYVANARELPAETRAYVSTIAPLLGAAPLPPAPSAAAVKSPTWRSAPLFVGGSNSASPTAEMRSGRRHDDSANAPQAPAGNPLSMPSPGLFVPRDSGGTSQ